MKVEVINNGYQKLTIVLPGESTILTPNPQYQIQVEQDGDEAFIDLSIKEVDHLIYILRELRKNE